MTPRWTGFAAPFRWLLAAVDVGRHQPGLLLGAVASVVALEVGPGLLAQAGGPASPITIGLMQALGLLIALFVAPVFKAGVYAVIEGGEQGRDMDASVLLAGFRDGRYPALVGVTLLSLLLFLLIGLVMLLTAVLGGLAADLPAIGQWLQQMQALQAEAGGGAAVPPDRLPAAPDALAGMVLLMLAFSPLLLIAGLASAWALIGVALRGLRPLAALLGALRAALLNAPALLLFVMVLFLPALLLGGLFGLLLGGIGALAGLAGAFVGQMLTALLLLGFSVLVTAVLYGFFWQGFRAACDVEASSGSAPTPPPHDHFEA